MKKSLLSCVVVVATALALFSDRSSFRSISDAEAADLYGGALSAPCVNYVIAVCTGLPPCTITGCWDPNPTGTSLNLASTVHHCTNTGFPFMGCGTILFAGPCSS